MDYKKEHDDALRRAKELHDAGNALTKAQMEIVFPQLAESEDERMINEIIHTVTGYHPIHSTKEINEMVAWLEKQKEPIDPEDRMNHPLYLEGFEVGRKVGWVEEDRDDISILKRHITEDSISELAHSIIVRNGWEIVEKQPSARQRMAERSNTPEGRERYEKVAEEMRKQIEQKPVEWSEEDEDRVLKGIIGVLEHDQSYGVSRKEMYDYLLSHRAPKWKPSEEQMDVLDAIVHFAAANIVTAPVLRSLYNDLKKL